MARRRPLLWLAAPALFWAAAASAQAPVDAQAPVIEPDVIAPALDGPSQGVPDDALPSRTIQTPHGGDTPDAQAPLLTVDQDELFARSAWGRRMQGVLDAERGKIVAENERLANQLSGEEADLTAQRAGMDPAEFRRRAEAFDARATQVRRERAQAVQDLNAWADADRTAFYRAALPIMGDMMQERGAVAVLDRRTVFVALDAIDMTEDLVTVLDRQLGDGAGVVPMTAPQGGADAAGPAPATNTPAVPD